MSDLPRLVVTFALAATLLLAISALGYVLAAPAPPAEPETELYLLGEDGRAADFPVDVPVGARESVTVVVHNRATTSSTYTVVATLGGRTIDRSTITVDPASRWRADLSFSPRDAGRTPLRVALYPGADADARGDPAYEVRLWIDAGGDGAAQVLTPPGA